MGSQLTALENMRQGQGGANIFFCQKLLATS
jgi:hypothetical protein